MCVCVNDLCIALAGHASLFSEETQATQLVSAEPGLELRSLSSKAGALLSPFVAC